MNHMVFCGRLPYLLVHLIGIMLSTISNISYNLACPNEQKASASGGLTQTTYRGSAPGPRWGTSVTRPLVPPPPLPPNPGYVTGFVLVVCYCIRAISAEPHRLPSRFRTSLSLFARRTNYKRHLSVDGTPVPRARWIWRLARRLRRPRA